MAYIPPIELTYGSSNVEIEEIKNGITGQVEKTILTAIHNAHVDVDRDELIKAMNYDRQQYEKGYADAKAEIIHCKDCRRRDEFGCCKHWVGLTMGLLTVATDDDDFCSYAKRRTE